MTEPIDVQGRETPLPTNIPEDYEYYCREKCCREGLRKDPASEDETSCRRYCKAADPSS